MNLVFEIAVANKRKKFRVGCWAKEVKSPGKETKYGWLKMRAGGSGEIWKGHSWLEGGRSLGVWEDEEADELGQT